MIIVKSEPIAHVTPGTEMLLTSSPKEIWQSAVANGQAGTISVHLPSIRQIDTIFLGFTNAHAESVWTLDAQTEIDGQVAHVFAAQPMRAADAISRPHAFARFAPIPARYISIYFSQPGPIAFSAGILMIGASYQSPHERGGGRQLIDTGTKEQLPDGGVGGEDGVIKAALKWRFMGLSDTMRRQFWSLVVDRGERRPVVVAEEADSEAAGANERIHYGTFDRLEAYERRDPNDTTWAMSMTEWV